MRFSRSLVKATFVLAVCVAATACSASDPTARPAPSPLTPAEFEAEANRICRELGDRLEQISAEEADDGFTAARLRNEARSEAFVELFALQPPDEARIDFQRMEEIQAELSGSAADRSIPEPDIGERLGPEWEALVERLNLQECR